MQNLKKSDRVFVFSQKGTWADSVSTSENHVFSTKHEAGVFHSVLTSWALLNSVPAVPNQTVLFDTLSTPNGAMIKKVAQILKINVTEIGAKKDALADVVFCTNSSAKDLLRNVKNGGSLVICNADSAGTVQVPYSASIFNNIHVRGFNMNAFMGSDNFLSGKENCAEHTIVCAVSLYFA